MRMTRRILTGAVALVATAGSVQAQQVRFAGATLGCFHVGIATPCTPVASAALLGISFSSGSFNVFTDPAALSGVSYGAIGNNTPLNSLGTVAAAGAFSASGNQVLRLRIAFSTPILTNDVNNIANDNVFDVDYRISGSSQSPGIGGINFIPTGPGLVGLGGLVFDAVNGVWRTGNFYTGGYANGDVFPTGPLGGIANGTVNYHTLDTRSVTAGGTATLSSFFQIDSTVTTPEPTTVGLMATGLAGLVGLTFRRRRTNG